MFSIICFSAYTELILIRWSLFFVFPIFSYEDNILDFDDSEQTRVLLVSAAYVHLKKRDFSKFTRNLSPASQAIWLSGSAGSSFGVSSINIFSVLRTNFKNPI